MKNETRINTRCFLLLIIFLFSTSLIALKTLKKVNIQDIRISGSELFSQNDLVNNSSLKLPIPLIFIKTNFFEKELRQNLSLKNVSVSRQIFPFGLKVYVETRTPVAYGERILNDKKITSNLNVIVKVLSNAFKNDQKFLICGNLFKDVKVIF